MVAGGQAAADVTLTRVDNAQFRTRFFHMSYQEELGSVPGHFGPVNAIAFSPDGKMLASGSADNTIKLWDTTTKKQIKTLEGHNKEVTSIAFSPNGKMLASGSVDKTIKIWRTSP